MWLPLVESVLLFYIEPNTDSEFNKNPELAAIMVSLAHALKQVAPPLLNCEGVEQDIFETASFYLDNRVWIYLLGI